MQVANSRSIVVTSLLELLKARPPGQSFGYDYHLCARYLLAVGRSLGAAVCVRTVFSLWPDLIIARMLTETAMRAGRDTVCSMCVMRRLPDVLSVCSQHQG